MAAFGVTRKPWREGKVPGTIVADEPVRPREDPRRVAEYGGHLICESIGKKADQQEIIEAVNARETYEGVLKDLAAELERGPGENVSASITLQRLAERAKRALAANWLRPNLEQRNA